MARLGGGALRVRPEMIRVAEVRPDSIGSELGIEPGTLLLAINGAELRDSVDLLFLQAEERVELHAETPAGQPVIYDIAKDTDASLGLVPEPDKIRRCTNACPFCFVKGNPKAEKLRPSLYVKDDDYRLSFLYGHYVTLTNLREPDWERIVEQRLSPLYISVHATDPEVRLAMLKNPRSADIHQHLDRLEAGGIAYHAQVVLCSELNDGPILARTIEDLYGRGESCLSLSIVPVGLTAYNADRGIRPLTEVEADQTLDRIEHARRRARSERGTAWCYAADELFLQAGREPPGAEYFDDHDLVANGVGAISDFRDRVRSDLGQLGRYHGLRIVLVTGVSMGSTLEQLASEIGAATGAELAVVVQENSLYGPTVTSAGLLPGRDLIAALRPYAGWDLALFSRAALNSDARFLDDLSLEELRTAYPALDIWPSDHVTEALSWR